MINMIMNKKNDLSNSISKNDFLWKLSDSFPCIPRKMIRDRRVDLFTGCCFFFLCCLNRFSLRWPIWMIDTFMHINTDAQRDNLDMQYWDLNWWEKAHSRGEHKETYVVIFRDQKKNNRIFEIRIKDL